MMGATKPTHHRLTVTLETQLASLPDLSHADLKSRWEDLYGRPPPKRIGRNIMVRAIAHRLQENALGGLRSATRRKLVQAAHDLEAGRMPKGANARVKPGTRLIREWQGVTHEVIVLENGVQFRGELWPSLSAVAREITGARWSGPRFFGLTGKAASDA